MKLLFKYLNLCSRGLAAFDPAIENRRQRFAQLCRGCEHPPRLLLVDRAAQLPRLFGGQQLQLRGQAEQIFIRRNQIGRICRKAQIQGIHQLQRRVSSMQLKRFGPAHDFLL